MTSKTMAEEQDTYAEEHMINVLAMCHEAIGIAAKYEAARNDSERLSIRWDARSLVSDARFETLLVGLWGGDNIQATCANITATTQAAVNDMVTERAA
jgi:hypothetical protein